MNHVTYINSYVTNISLNEATLQVVTWSTNHFFY
jgi:hypothetical protein